MAKMKVNFISGISGDSVVIKIFDDFDKNILFQERYYYGENASCNRKFEEIARRNHEQSEKYGWTNTYPLKPFIGDIIRDLIEAYYIENNIEYTGYNVFTNKELTTEEIQKIVDAIAEEL